MQEEDPLLPPRGPGLRAAAPELLLQLPAPGEQHDHARLGAGGPLHHAGAPLVHGLRPVLPRPGVRASAFGDPKRLPVLLPTSKDVREPSGYFAREAAGGPPGSPVGFEYEIVPRKCVQRVCCGQTARYSVRVRLLVRG